MARKNMASVSVDITGNSRGLVTELTKAQKKTNAAIKQMNKRWRALSRSVKGFAGVFAGAFAIGSIQQILDQTDRLAKSFRASGFESFEAFQKMRLGAELAGLSTGAFDKSFAKASKTVVDAERGLKTAKDNLDDINLSVADLKDLNPEERYLAIVKGLEGVSDEGRRSAIAQQLLGREFATNQVSVQNLTGDTTGLIVVTEDAAKAIEEFNDNISFLAKSVANLMANAIGGWLERNMRYFKTIKQEVIGYNEVMVQTTLRSGEVIEQIRKIPIYADPAANAIEELKNITGDYADSANEAAVATNTLALAQQLAGEKRQEVLDAAKAEEEHKLAQEEQFKDSVIGYNSDIQSSQQKLQQNLALYETQGNKARAKATLDMFADTTKAMGQFSKDQFNMHKNLSMVQATISGAMAIITTLADPLVPTWLKPVAVATMAALTAAQVQTIQNTQPPATAMAQGGIVQREGYAMVGETGREIMHMQKGAQVIRNSRTEEIMGGDRSISIGSININDNSGFANTDTASRLADDVLYEIDNSFEDNMSGRLYSGGWAV